MVPERSRPIPLTTVLVLLFASLCLRLFLAPYVAFPLDMDLMQGWGHYAVEHGVTQIADAAAGKKREMYPPLFYYQNAALTHVGSAQLVNLEQNYPEVAKVWERVRFKLIPIGYDLLTGILILVVLAKLVPPPWPLVGAAAYLLNPCIFINSGWVGQVDCVHSLFLFASILCLCRALCGRASWYLLAWVMYAIAACYKLQSIVLLPLLLTITWMRRTEPLALAGPVVGFLCGLAIYSPFLIAGRLDYLDHVFIRSFTVSTFTHLTAFNFWAFGNVKPVSDTVLGITYGHIGHAAYLSTLLWLFLALGRAGFRQDDPPDTLRRLFIAAAYACIAPFMVLTAMHERYIAPAIAFLVVTAFLDRRLRWLAIGFSVTYTLNLLFVLRPSDLPPAELAIRNASSFAVRIFGAVLNSGMFLWLTVRLHSLLLPPAPDREPSSAGPTRFTPSVAAH
jgi:Gpi18-like mannosyltransferase